MLLMKFNKNKKKSVNKKAFIKSLLILFCFSLIYLSICFSNAFIKNSDYNLIYKKFQEDNFFRKENINCDKYDPIFLMAERLKKNPIILCNSKDSKHICYQNSKYALYNKITLYKYGVICKSENFILDPSKSFFSNYIYKGPIDKINLGAPILSKGFFNIKCETNEKLKKYHRIYKNYFQSWEYNVSKDDEQFEMKIPELASGKTIFFLSRNQDSPNLFHGISEFINAISILYLFKLNPENIQIVFLESMKFDNDPFLFLYKNIISRGGEPLYIRDLKQKYHITNAFHIPINWDSPSFIRSILPKENYDCKYSTQTYNILNNLLNKYLNIPNFKDSFISDGNSFYYPDSVVKNSNITNISITIQWRKVWPRDRSNQQRILGNGPELTEKLASILPKNFLIRLVDTASLSIIEQISIMRKTNYLIGVHGAGLSLSIFMPPNSVLYEILPKHNIKSLLIMSGLSGHKVYSDIIKSEKKVINNNDVYFFDSNEFIKNVLKIIRN